MPTPNLHLDSRSNPFADVPAEYQSSRVEVFYVTDRQAVRDRSDRLEYTYGRSRSMAFGTTVVEFGHNVSWAQLVQASRSSLRDVSLPIRLEPACEWFRFPPTPPAAMDTPDGDQVESPDWLAERDQAERAFRDALSRRLSLGPCKDVFLYVHGFNNDFEDSVSVAAQIWHFLGRRGVPLAYSWPAGSGGLRGYAYDRESGEFTLFHLKHLFRMLGACPAVGRVHVLAHSRGTDVAVSALRELHLEFGSDGARAREALKLGTLVLASPDIDLDVGLQRLAAERLFSLPESTVIYLSEGDWALRLANWLFLGMVRLGRLKPSDLTPEQLAVIQRMQRIQLIDTYDASTGVLGHSDFYSSPAVSSDLVLVLRDGKAPGAAHGRPLTSQPSGFWRIGPDYPRFGP